MQICMQIILTTGAGISYPDGGWARLSFAAMAQKGWVGTSMTSKRTSRVASVGPPALAWVKAVREKMRLPRKVFSRLTGFSERAIADWESGKALSEPGMRRVKEIERFQQRLAEVIKEEAIPEWLEKPNAAFGDLKPLEVI